MKRNQWHNKGLGTWVLTGVASLLIAATAFGQLSVNQPSGITIPDYPLFPAAYPQELSISNLVGRISKVTLTLNNVKHAYVSDLSAMLVYKDTNNVSGSVVLMSEAGGSSEVNGVNITFDDNGATLPEFSQLGAGPYKPADYRGVPFPAGPGTNPPPAAASATSLTNAFQNKYPNGKWSLYTYDAEQQTSGQLASWTLNVWTFPEIVTTNSSLAVTQNSSGTYYFTVKSATTDPANLTVTATSQDTTILSATNLVVGGSGQNRTLTVTPKINELRPVTVKITVSDAGGSATTDLAVTIIPVNQPPTISLSTNAVYTTAGVITVPVTANVADFDNTSSQLTVTVSSSDESVVSSNNVFFASTTAAARNFTVVPTGTGSGQATLTLKVSDTNNLSATTTLTVNVAPATHPQFANTKILGFTAAGTTNSSIVISNIAGKIGSATVSLTGLKNMQPSITDVALVVTNSFRANGGSVNLVLLNSGAAGTFDYARVRLDSSAGTLPASSSINEVNVGANLAALNNFDPNGTWTLWVTNGGTGSVLLGGWLIDLHTAPSVTTSVTNIVMNAGSTNTSNFALADLDGSITNASDVTVTSADTTIVTASNTYNVGSKTGTVTLIAPGPKFGSTTVTLTAKDNDNFTVTFVYNVTVNFVNHAPTISFLGRVFTRAGTPVNTDPFTISDVDLPYTNQIISVTARSSDQKLIPDSNLSFSGTGLTRTLTLFPLGTNVGTANISVIASDGLASTTNTFQFFVDPPGNPLFANLGQIQMFANSAAAPYPSTANISGLVGQVADVQVTLFGVNNDIPDNMNVMLVSPNNKTNVLLMSHVGGSNPLANGTTILTFSDSAAGSLPDSGQIVSGNFRPTAVGTPATFPAPAPTPRVAPLAAFDGLSGTNLNGVWSLFIVDDGLGRGVIANGWQLSILTAPSIQPIADVTLPKQPDNPLTKDVIISIGDDQPGVNITVTANSTPTGYITTDVVGTGGTRTLKITPVPYQSRSNIVVTVTASSSLGAPSTQTFNVTVYNVNLPPVISAIPGTTNSVTKSQSTTFKVWDPQGAPLTLTAVSDNKRLVPDANISIVSTGSSGGTNSYQLTLLPADIQTGTAKITVEANDNVNQKASQSFFAQVNPGVSFINIDGGIIIPEGAPVAATATPYPSKAVVSGIDGYVTSVEVTLLGLTHSFPQDMEMLLVSPDNKATILLAHAGGSTAIAGARISIADGGQALQVTDSLANFGRYAPASFTSGLDFGVPNVAASSYKTNLAALTGAGTHPNGEWSLYIRDSAYPDGGLMTGWILSLTTSPSFAPGSVVDRETPENTPLVVPITVVSQSTNPASLVVYASAGKSSPTNLPNFNLVSNLQITNNTGGNRTLIITPTSNLPSSVTNVNGTVPIILDVVDGQITNTASFILTVLWGNQAPRIVASTNNLYLDENPLTGIQSSVEVTFTLSDPDSRLFTSNAVVRFADSSLIPNSTNNLLVTASPAIINQGETGTVVVKLTPASAVSGTNKLTLTMTDGTASSVSEVTLNVKSVYQPPFISGLAASYNSPAGTVAGPYNFTVGSVEGVPATSLILSASSSNQGLVPNSQVVLTGTDAARTIQMTPIGTISGATTITLVLADPVGNKTNTTTFVLNVTAPPAGLFGNSQVITVVGNPTNAPSWTYPVVFSVTNIVGPIANVSLQMRGYSNSSPVNLDALLVAPDQTAVMLTSGGGGTDPVNNLNLTFDDSGIEMPVAGPLSSGTYHPSYYTKRLLPGSPTTNVYQARLRAFEGKTDYIGDWKLYLNQQAFGTFAKFSDGFYLKVTPAPLIVVPSTSIALQENERTTLTFDVQDSLAIYGTNLSVAASSDNTALLPVGTPTSPQTNNTFQLPLNPSTYVSGVANVTLTATRKSDGVSSSLVVRVSVAAKNFPPTISRLPDVHTPANTPVSIQFLVADPDSPISSTNMVVEATSDNRAVLDPTNMVFTTSGSNVVKGLPPSKLPGTSELVFNMVPNQFAIGSANVTIKVTDSLPEGTNIVTSNFVFYADPRVFDPTIGTVPAQSVIAGRSTAPISLSVGSPNQPPPNLQVFGSSSDQTLILNSGIAVAPTAGGVSVPAWSVTITAVPQGGSFTPRTAVVTLRVEDKTNLRTNSTSFNVTVLPPPVHVFVNTNSIEIVDNSKANPYPSQIAVTGLVGNVSKVTATLIGFSHRYPADANVLLVGPGGTNKVVLMGKAGGGNPISPTNAVTLTFDMSAPNSIPQGSTLTSGSYKPANYNALFNYPPDAPVGPYSSDLALFNGAQANGTWGLYIVDDSQPDAGAVQGWSLSIETSPVLALSTNYLVMNMNTTNTVGITITDDAPPGDYVFGATATNSTLIPSTNVTFTGANRQYTASIRPAANQYGTNELTIWSTNILNQFASAKLLVNVLLVTNPPVIISVGTQTIVQAQIGNVPFAFGDALVEQDKLIVSFSSSNPSLIPATNIKLANALSTSVGVSTNSLLFLPAGAGMGSADITVTVAQPANRGGLSSRSTFTVNVLRSPTPIFANTASIVISNLAPSTPYPSTVEVSNVVGKVRTVSVDIIGLSHSYPSDISMLLLGPKGQKVVLMSRAGNGFALSGVSFQFDQGASNAIPQGSQIVSGAWYKPENYNGALTFYDPMPAGPIVTNLNAFADTDPNGTWSLYVQDDQSPDFGNIAGGWTLRLVTTAPTISTVAAQVTPENTTLSVPISVNSPVVASSNLTVTASSSGSSPTNLIGSVTVSMNATNKSLGTVVIVPTADLPSAVTTADGTSTITVSVTDGTNTASTTFPLTVLYVNQPPRFVGLQNLSTPANYPVSLNFSLTDVDSPSNSVALAGFSSSNTNLGAVTVAIAAGGYILNFVPAGDVGVTTVSLAATDGVRFTTNNISINVTPGAPPVIADILPLTVAEATNNRTLTVDLSITNFTTAMTVTGVSSNTNLATVRITGSGAKWTAFVDVARYVSGETTIGIVASTIYGNGNRTFKVTVTPVDFPPVIATIPPQTTTANIPITVPLTITDPDTALSQLTVAAASSDTLLVTSSVVSNNGTNVSVTLNVAECRAGVATITVTAADNASTVTNKFQLTVRAPQPPVIESINDITNTNTALTFIPVPVEIESPLKPITALTITGSSSNTNLVSGVTIAVSGTNVTANLALVAGKKGLSTITISVSDCVTTVTETFNYIVPEPTPATMSATVTNGVLTINITGGAGTTYTIQNSTNLVAWTDLSPTVTTDANGKATYPVSLAGKPARGFYRTIIK